jgi:hypothetical protein
LGQAAAWAQDPNDPKQQPQTPPDPMRGLQEKAVRLIRATQELGDWNQHYEYMLDAMDRIFERNEWDSESDVFSLELVREVGRIPPWRTFERFDKALEMVGDRYLLDEDQAASLQGKVIRANIDLFSRHSDRIMEYALEAIETRVAGEPFTPEQVARWTTLAEPVFLDARKNMNELAKEFMEELDPEQRELVEADLAAANRRMLDVDRMGQRWKRGEWDPHDWGMEHDPIQNPSARLTAASAAGDKKTDPDQTATRGESKPANVADAKDRPDGRKQPTSKPTDDDAWAKYVRAFIRKYHLNHEQQQRAWLVFRDAKARDEVFARRFERQMNLLREKAAASTSEKTQAALRDRTEQRQREVQRLFNQLKRRLVRLPTRAQRKNAEPGEIDVSQSPTEKTDSPGKTP